MTTRRMITWSLILVTILTLLLVLATPPSSKADVGGQVPSPSSCSYPATGAFGLDGIVDHYVCDYPLEINSSRHHCVFGGAAATVGANVSLWIFQASISTNIGVLEGVCYWACPDGSVSAEPNPVGTWQGSSSSTTPVTRTKCKTIAPNPLAPPPPPDAEPPAPA